MSLIGYNCHYNGKEPGWFKNGNFEVKNLDWAEKAADKIFEIEKFYNGFKRRSFVSAMILLFKKKEYNHKQFLQKLEFNSHKLTHCANTSQYINLIEEIYNWKAQEKVRFY